MSPAVIYGLCFLGLYILLVGMFTWITHAEAVEWVSWNPKRAWVVVGFNAGVPLGAVLLLVGCCTLAAR